MIDHAQLAAQMRRLPSFPSAVAQLLRITKNPRSTAADLEQAIKHDASLSANILRLANSAVFGLRRQVSSISHAVALLGQGRVRDMAVTATYSNLLPSTLAGYDMPAQSFFQHSAAVGVISAELASTVGMQDKAEDAFLAGLLHDIGKLAIGVFLEESRENVMEAVQRQKLTFVAAEREVLGTDHAQVGSTLGARWELPKLVVAVTKLHHEPERAVGQEAELLVDVVHLADALAHSLGWGTDRGELARRADPAACARLQLKERHLEVVACNTMDRIRAIVDIGEESG